MPRYLIERTLPNASALSREDVQGIGRKSNQVIAEMRNEGKQLQWVESYVSPNAITCLYLASGPDVLQEHAKRGGFPCDNIREVTTVIDPATGE